MFDAQHVKRPGNDWSSAEPTQKSGRTKRSTQYSGDLTRIPRYAQAWGNQPPPWLRPSIPQQTPPEGETLQRATTPTQHKENMTGLPDTLKAGVEKLSGLSMDDVQVHYNSSQPAEVQALAYTQGTDIHVGPGQQQHLGHEAWHVVQQMQGRVKPTMQMKNMAINEEQGLEREADMMAAKISESGSVRNNEESTDTISSASKDNPIRSSRIYPLQMKLNKVLSDEVDSPAGAIKRQLGNIPVKDLSLPGTQPAGQEERARKVEAIVDKTTLRDTERSKSGNLSKVTTMARAEQFILQGADVKKFFDAGHLVGDQLVGGKEATFQL